MKKRFGSSLTKDILRTIKYSIPRFLAIIAMTGLATMVFIGLSSGVPNLRSMVVNKVESHNFHDIKIRSYTGIRPEDIKKIEAIEGLDQVEYQSFDVFRVKNQDYSLALYTKTDQMDTFTIREGRLPNKKGEIALDYLHLEDMGNQLGQKITFNNKEGMDGEDILKETTFEIVGYVDSVDYMGTSRNASSQSGAYFGVVEKEDLVKEYQDQALIRLSTFAGQDISSKEYRAKETALVDKLIQDFEGRPVEVENSLVDEANEKIQDAEKEIQDGKDELESAREDLADAKVELDDAKVELDDAKVELTDADRELIDAKNELDQGRADLEEGRTQLNREIADARAQVREGQAKLDEAKAELASGRRDYEEGLRIFEREIANGQAELDKAKETLDQSKARLDQAEADYQAGLDQYQAGLAQYEAGFAQYEEGLAQYQEGKAQYDAALAGGAYQMIEAGLAQIASQRDQILASPVEIPNQDVILAELNRQEADLIAQRTELDQTGQMLAESKARLESTQVQLDQSKAELDAAKADLDQGQAQLEAGRAQYDQGLAEYEAGLERLESERTSGQAELDEAKAKLDAGQAEIDRNQAEINSSIARINREEANGQAELDKAQADLNQGQADYNQGLAEYKQGRADYDQGLADYNQGLEEYQDGLKEFEEEEIKANQDIAKGQEDIAQAKEDIENIRVPAYQISGKYNEPTFYSFISQADSLSSLSIIFTIMFYLVAILVTLTTILRMVETERTQIGTMKALGYSRTTILLKYLIYGLSATIIGSILGILIGYYILMPPIIDAYVSASNITDNPMIFEWDKAVLIFAVSLLIIGGTIIFAIGRNLRENAASLMRPKPPKKASRTIFEKIPFLWNNLSFLNKVSVRNVMRSKVRMFMTILGVSGSFSLIAMAFGVQGSIANVGNRQFNQVYKFDAQLVYDSKADDFEQMVSVIDKDITDKLSLIMTQGMITNQDGMNEDLSIYAVDKDSNFNDFIKLAPRDSSEKLHLQDGQIIVSEKITTVTGLGLGDELEFKDENGKNQVMTIGGITEHYFGHHIYMTEGDYHKLIDQRQDNNTFLLKFNNLNEDQIDKYDSKISEYEANLTYLPNMDLADTLDTISSSLNLVIVLIVALSAMLTFVVLHNLTNINISERLREISTIKVLGFRPGEVVSYIFKENIFLTLIGILIGIGLAKIMHRLIVYSLSPGGFLFDPYLNPISYLWAGLIVVAFTILVMLTAKRNMGKIDMVDALKGVE